MHRYRTGADLGDSGHQVARGAIIVANYPAQNFAPRSWTAVKCESTRDRGLLRPALVGPGGIVVVNVCTQDRPQVPLAENQDLVNATLRAFNLSGAQIAQDGPKQVGPGPVEANTVFQVQVPSPAIRRVELRYEGAFAELIVDLEFDVKGEVAQPDVEPLIVTIVRPASGATLTGESFVLEANITEDRRLSEVLLTIAGGQGSVTFSSSFSGQTPDFKVGPIRTQPHALGINVITITARDLADNEGQARSG